MSEDEMYDVSGGFLGWSGDKFTNNVGVIAGAIWTAVKVVLGVAGITTLTHLINQFIGSGVGLNSSAKQVAANVSKASVATAKALYGVLSISWGWTLGIGAAALLIGVTALGYITL